MAASKKRSGSKKKSSAKKSSAKKSSAKKSSARKTSAKKAGKRGGQKTAAKKQARKAARSTARAATAPADALDFSGKSVADFRNALRKNLIRPFEAMIISRKRIEEVMEDAVTRGRVTADDAQALVQGLVDRGRKETNDMLRDLEQLMGRGRSEVSDAALGARKRSSSAAALARKQVEDATSGARKRARDAADPLLAQADRARRTVGVGPVFPIVGYDDLSASQVQARLDSLTPAELRKVRDYERRHGNRKTVLTAIEQKLSA
jgi:polyhydroxyalkanoate synthesis regulator phasin